MDMGHFNQVYAFPGKLSVSVKWDVTQVLKRGTHLFQVGHQSLPVGQPFSGQSAFWGEFVAAQLQSDLKAVSVQVVKVLHACKHKISDLIVDLSY